MCAQLLREFPAFLPVDLAGDASQVAAVWASLAERVVESGVSPAVFVVLGVDRMLVPPCSWLPSRLTAGVRVILPMGVWQPADTGCDTFDLALPALSRHAAERLLQTTRDHPQELRDCILRGEASPLYILLAANFASVNAEAMPKSVVELFCRALALAETTTGASAELCLSLVALASSVGTCLRRTEIDAIISQEVAEGSVRPTMSMEEVDASALASFFTEQDDGGVALCHDVLTAEVLRLYALTPAMPCDDNFATRLHGRIGTFLQSQCESVVQELRAVESGASSDSRAKAAERVSRCSRVAEMAVTHRICAGEWGESLRSLGALSELRSLRAAHSALSLQLDELEEIIEGGRDGLREARAAKTALTAVVD